MEEKYLFPVVNVPVEEAEEEEYDEEYRPSALWDFEKGDFAVDGAGRVVEANGMEAFIQWCVKAAQTERYTCLAYDDDIGTEIDSLEKDDPLAVESEIERTITEALMVNPRTEYVRDFEFTSNGDVLNCTFTVKGIGFEERILTIGIGDD